MRPKKTQPKDTGDLFRSRLDQIINMSHELVRLADELDWEWIDEELAGLFSDQSRPGTETRFMIGLLQLKHIYGMSDEGVGERWIHDPYFRYFTGEEFFCHAFPHERSGMTHWRKHIGRKLYSLHAPEVECIGNRKRAHTDFNPQNGFITTDCILELFERHF